MMNTEKEKVPGAMGDKPPFPLENRAKTFQERYAEGKVLRQAYPRELHANWNPPASRPDPVQLVLDAEEGRIPDLLPLRHGRMAQSPFAFYRGAALTMASDLSSTPNTGIYVQCCGDAHLSNFGGFATPERKIIFSINDLDETLPAPWEWDIKRLATSFLVACRDKGIKDADGRVCVLACVGSYREYMAEYARMKTLDLWYESLGPEKLISAKKDPELYRRAMKRIHKEQAKSRGEELFPKMAELRGGKEVIKDQLPTIFHNEEFPQATVRQQLLDAFAAYRDTLPPASQSLLDRFQIRDAAFKVVGVGSVGTYCVVLLLMGDDGDPLFLQVKQARASVLEPYAGRSAFHNHGQRVVNGYRLMQPASDVFLGYSHGPKRDFFIRQLRDTKISILVENFDRSEMELYATWCGRALALSHARSGKAAILYGYMGKSDKFDQAIASFSVAYADQNEKDYAAFKEAIRFHKVEAVFEEKS